MINSPLGSVLNPYPTYRLNSIPSGGHVRHVDIGPVPLLLERAGASHPGKKRTAFKEASAGMVGIRIGFDMAAIPREEFDRLVKDVQWHADLNAALNAPQ